MSSMFDSGGRLVPSLLAVASGLTAAAVVGATSYVLFGTGSIGGPPQSPRAAVLRFAHLLHQSDVKDLGIVACPGLDSTGERMYPLLGVTWRLDPGQLDAHATAFTLGSTDGLRHVRMQTTQTRTGWCVSAVATS